MAEDDKAVDQEARAGDDRAARQAKALRENLRRRKDQARRRRAAGEVPTDNGGDRG